MSTEQPKNETKPAPLEPADESRPSRAPYVKPTLTKLGNVNDLTLAVRAAPLSDGGGKNTMAM